jgi:hypothetical protein
MMMMSAASWAKPCETRTNFRASARCLCDVGCTALRALSFTRHRNGIGPFSSFACRHDPVRFEIKNLYRSCARVIAIFFFCDNACARVIAIFFLLRNATAKPCRDRRHSVKPAYTVSPESLSRNVETRSSSWTPHTRHRSTVDVTARPTVWRLACVPHATNAACTLESGPKRSLKQILHTRYRVWDSLSLFSHTHTFSRRVSTYVLE